MQSSNHFCFGDARNQALLDRRSSCDPQRMAIQTALTEKVARFQNTYDCFLAPLGNNGELDLALPNIKNRVRLAALGENNLVFVILGYRFPIADFCEKYFWIECRPHTLPHRGSRFSRTIKRVKDMMSSFRPPANSGLSKGSHLVLCGSYGSLRWHLNRSNDAR